MAIKWIGQEWCPDARDYRREFVCDTNADLSKLPAAPYGSTAMVAASGKTCIVNASGQWIDTETGKVIPGAGVSNAPTGGNSGSSGGSSGGSGVSHWDDLDGRPFYDTRETVATEPVTVTGSVVTWGLVKVADTLDVDIESIKTMNLSISGQKNSYENEPIRITTEYKVHGINSVLSGDWFGVYFENQEAADYYWDSDEPNPFTSGLYINTDGDEGMVYTITYGFTYPSGELKTIDLKFLPDGYPADTRKTTVIGPVTAEGRLLTWVDGDYTNYGMYKLADNIEFDISKVTNLSIRRCDGEGVSVKNLPVRSGMYGESISLVNYDDGPMPCVVYFPTQEAADMWWDGENNPYTPGLYVESYVCMRDVEYSDMPENVEFEYTMFCNEGELKPIAKNLLPEGYPYVQTKMVSMGSGFGRRNSHSWMVNGSSRSWGDIPVEVGDNFDPNKLTHISVKMRFLPGNLSFEVDKMPVKIGESRAGTIYYSEEGNEVAICLATQQDADDWCSDNGSGTYLPGFYFMTGRTLGMYDGEENIWGYVPYVDMQYELFSQEEEVTPIDLKYLPEQLAYDALVTEEVKITWDGDTNGRTTFEPEEGLTLCKVSDILPTVDQLKAGIVIDSADYQFDMLQLEFVEDSIGCVVLSGDMAIIFVAYNANFAPEMGLYFAKLGDEGYIKSVSCEATFNKLKKIDPKFLPDGLPSATEGLVPVVEKKTLDFTNTNYQNASALPQLVPGEIYVVDWNGTLYECVANERATSGGDQYIGIGNWATRGSWAASDWGDTGEPFLYCQYRYSYHSSSNPYIFAEWNAYEGTGIVEAGVYQKGTVVTKVNPKCMPEGYPGYEVVDTEVMNFTNEDADDRGNLPTDFMPNLGDKFTVVYNGETYETECRASRHYDGDVVCIGNPNAINGTYPSTMEPFSIMFPLWKSDYTKVQMYSNDSTWSVRVIYHKRIYTTMDSRYIAKEWPHSEQEMRKSDVITTTGTVLGYQYIKVADVLEDPTIISHITFYPSVVDYADNMLYNQPVRPNVYSDYIEFHGVYTTNRDAIYFPTDAKAQGWTRDDRATAGLYCVTRYLKNAYPDVTEVEYTFGYTTTTGEAIKLPEECLPDAATYDVIIRFVGNDDELLNGDKWIVEKGYYYDVDSARRRRGYLKTLIICGDGFAEPYLSVCRNNSAPKFYFYCYHNDTVKNCKFTFSGTRNNTIEEVTA